MKPKAMTFGGIILVICGLVLISCAHQDKQLQNARRFSQQAANTKTEFYAPPEIITPAILHIMDRDAKTGRFIKVTINPHTGQKIVAKWTAYRDATNHTIYGVEYNQTDNP